MNLKSTKKYIAVIDTETNWNNEVMSIGAVIADRLTFEQIDSRYYVIVPERDVGGIYAYAIDIAGRKADLEGSRDDVISDLLETLSEYDVDSIFAYNANFDYRHLPEMKEYSWFDIMKLAAYRQYNKSIPNIAECCNTGRLKRGYGVESIIRYLSGAVSYREVHNALHDAVDELEIMKMLGHSFEKYDFTRIN